MKINSEPITFAKIHFVEENKTLIGNANEIDWPVIVFKRKNKY